MRNQKGVTLIALVITIVVLLILAGVTISLTLGQNGALTQARKAVNQNEAATAQEEVELVCSEASMQYYSALGDNQNIKSIDYFSNSEYYQHNCPRALAVRLIKDSTNNKVYVLYTSSSRVNYYFEISIAADDSYKVSSATKDKPTALNTVNEETGYVWAVGSYDLISNTTAENTIDKDLSGT